MENYDELQRDFEGDGFVHLRGFMSPAEMEEIEKHLARFIRDVVPTLPKAKAMYEDYARPETLKQLAGLEADPFFAQLLANPKLIGLVQALLRDAVVPESKNKIQLFNKPPDWGKATPPHQDGYYFCLVPNEAATVWIALDDIDDENGALGYIRGSHKKGVLPHDASQVLGFSQGLTAGARLELGEEVICRVNRGDVLVHHSLTVHFAGANTSRRSRRAIGLVYYAQKAKLDEEAFRRVLESLERQRKAQGVV